jgi:ParB family chromosome partitioning protein
MSLKPQSKGLGRGLAALLGDAAVPASVSAPGVQMVPIIMLGPSPFQARRAMDEDALKDLAASIAKRGILQPILVRPTPGVEGSYQIIAGERRWRAAQLAQLHEVPVLARQFSDQDAMAAGLVENLQREDLNAVEEAEGYQRLLTEFKLNQETLADAVGKSRSHITHMLRVLKLPEKVLGMVRSGELSFGHAKALTNHGNPILGARQIIDKKLSVRQAEEMANDYGHTFTQKVLDSRPPKQIDPELAALANSLSEKLGLRVNVTFDGKSGTLMMHYKNLDQLDEVLRLLNG